MKMDKPRTAVARRPLAELEQHRGFVDRHIGTTDAEQAEMLNVLGYASRSALIDAAVPAAIRLREPLALSAAKGEEEALDEWMAMARRVGKSASNAIWVADDVLPQTIDVVRTRARPLGLDVVVGPAAAAAGSDCFAALLQYPGVNGDVRDYRALAQVLHAKGALVLVAADLLALTLLTPPGEWGADVAVG